MTLDGLLGWLLVGIGLAGTVLNIRKARACFLVWLASNSSLAALNAAAGRWPMAALFAVYTAMAVWGWFAWGKQIGGDGCA